MLSISCIFIASGTNAQMSTRGTDHSLSLNVSYVQIKDQFNYGLSFGGLNLAGAYELRYHADRLDLSYGAALGMGAVHEKGVGILLRLKPLDGFAGFGLIRDSKKKACSGSIPVGLLHVAIISRVTKRASVLVFFIRAGTQVEGCTST